MAIEFTADGTPMVKYNDTQGWYDAWNKFRAQTNRWNNNADELTANELTRYGDTFSSQFKQLVGRDPNQVEFGRFWNEVVVPQGNFLGGGSNPGMQELQDRTGSFVSSNFQRAAEEQAALELQGQQAEANRLSDLFRTQGNTAIDGYQSSLLDFTNKLIERVRPNLMLSLQSQGLLNTGGLNQAIAGQQSDLSRDAAQQVADLRLQNENQANEISFGAAAAPYEFQKAMAMNRVPQLQSQGQSAIDRLFTTRTNEINFANQMARDLQLSKYGNRGKSGFFQQFGNAFAPSLGMSVGQNLGKFAAPPKFNFMGFGASQGDEQS